MEIVKSQKPSIVAAEDADGASATVSTAEVSGKPTGVGPALRQTTAAPFVLKQIFDRVSDARAKLPFDEVKSEIDARGDPGAGDQLSVIDDPRLDRRRTRCRQGGHPQVMGHGRPRHG